MFLPDDAPVRCAPLDVDLVPFRSGNQLTAAIDRRPHRWDPR
jgi:hypothetical protein